MNDRIARYALGALVLAIAGTDVAARFEPNTWLYRDGRFFVNVNENLVENQSLEDPFAHSWYDGKQGWNFDLPASFSNVALGDDGEYWHFRPWILPVLSTPFYLAFGLIGVLLFNVLGLVVVALGFYGFARAFAEPGTALIAAAGMLLGSGLRIYGYNYSVDVLLLAFFAMGLFAAVQRRGLWAGALVACACIIKPTTVVYALPIALLVLERRDLRTLGAMVVGGLGVFAIAGAMNTYMYGRPWWTGYHRVLTVVQGEQVVVSDVDAFTMPFDVGARELWMGEGGVRGSFGFAMLVAPVGWIALARKKPLYVIGAVASAVGSFLLFSRFEYQNARFLFPAYAMQAPAVAAGLGALAAFAGRIVRRRVAPELACFAAALAAVAISIATLGAGPSLSDRIPMDGYRVGATALAGGVLDLRELDVPVDSEASPATRTRFGTWIARAPMPAVLVAAPFAAAGPIGLFVLHLLAIAVLVFSIGRLLQRALSSELAALFALAAVFIPPLREAAVEGGPELLGAALFVSGVALFASRPRVGVVLAVLGAWCIEAPWLGAVVLALAIALAAERVKIGIAGGSVLAIWAALSFAIIGRPFASPHDFVVVSVGGADAYSVPAPSLWSALAIEGPGLARAFAVLAILAAIGALLSVRRPLAFLAIAALAAVCAIPGVGTSHHGYTMLPTAIDPYTFHLGSFAIAPLVVVVIAIGLAFLVSGIAEQLSRLRDRVRSRHLAIGGAVALVAFVAAGGVARAVREDEPFRIASPAGVRHATVLLGETPCDFLAWEMMSWECSSFDGGRDGRTGLALPAGVTVGGAPEALFLIPSASRAARPRTVEWTTVAGSTLVLHVAYPDGPYAANARVIVRVDGAEVDSFVVEKGAMSDRRVEMARAGEMIALSIEMTAIGRGRAAIAVDGWFE